LANKRIIEVLNTAALFIGLGVVLAEAPLVALRNL
jgi:hypothetical protein